MYQQRVERTEEAKTYSTSVDMTQKIANTLKLIRSEFVILMQQVSNMPIIYTPVEHSHRTAPTDKAYRSVTHASQHNRHKDKQHKEG
jgi:hypothetical protein